MNRARSLSFLSLAVVVATTASISRTEAAEPRLEKADVFTAGERGFAGYRIPGIVVTKAGSVLAYCEARKHSKSDWGEIEIHLRRSTDGGRTWDAPRQIAHMGPRVARNPVALAKKSGGPADQTVNNPVAITDQVTGAVHLLYCIEYMRCFYLRSDDDGVTWSSPTEITATFEEFRPEYNWRVIATGPGHGIQLRNGRLLVPVWLSTSKTSPHGPTVAATIYSDDHGGTWQRGELVTTERFGPNESAVVELSDGRVLLNARQRTAAPHRLVVTSRDGATGWSEPRFDPALTEPVCMAGMVMIPASAPQTRSRLIFTNPASGTRERKNLTTRISEDDGQTWSYSRSLESGPSAYSDLAVLPDGTILCFYERGVHSEKPSPYDALTLARFNMEWIMQPNVGVKK